jgi:hypothetical protein
MANRRERGVRATADRLADVQQQVLLGIDRQQAKGALSGEYFCHSVPRGQNLGEATLSVVKANGDVVLVDQFYQDARSAEDIAQQPITAAWSALCKAGK